MIDDNQSNISHRLFRNLMKKHTWEDLGYFDEQSRKTST